MQKKTPCLLDYSSSIKCHLDQEPLIVEVYVQGGQNLRIVRIFYFVTLKLYGLYGFFFKLYGLYGFLSWKFTGFFFTHFSKFFMKISKKKSRQNEVSFCILNNIRLINVSIDNQNSFIIFEIPAVFI